MYYYRYSITLCKCSPLVAPSVMYLWYNPMQSNHRVHTTSKNLEIPKGRTILSWGRLYNDKPKTTIFKPKLHICTHPCCIPQYKQWSIPMSYTFVSYITTTNQGIIYMFSNHTHQYICIMQLNTQSLSTIGYNN